MISFDTVAYETMLNYFKALSKTGRLNDRITCQVLLEVSLTDFLEEYRQFITEEDFNYICRMLDCLQENSCVVPNMKDNIYKEVIDSYRKDISVRIASDSRIRNTEKHNMRLSE